MFFFVLSIVFFCSATIGILCFSKRIVGKQRGMFTILMLGIIAITSIAIFTIGYFMPAAYEFSEARYELVEFTQHSEYRELPGFEGKYVGIDQEGRYYCYFNDNFHVCETGATLIIAEEKHEIVVKAKEPVLGFWSYQGYWKSIPEIVEETIYVPYGTLME